MTTRRIKKIDIDDLDLGEDEWESHQHGTDELADIKSNKQYISQDDLDQSDIQFAQDTLDSLHLTSNSSQNRNRKKNKPSSTFSLSSLNNPNPPSQQNKRKTRSKNHQKNKNGSLSSLNPKNNHSHSNKNMNFSKKSPKLVLQTTTSPTSLGPQRLKLDDSPVLESPSITPEPSPRVQVIKSKSNDEFQRPMAQTIKLENAIQEYFTQLSFQQSSTLTSSSLTTKPASSNQTSVNDTLAKPSFHLLVCGHVDAGKSTMIGHLLSKMGWVNPRTLKKYESECQILKKKTFEYAWVMDTNDEERNRGITMDIAIATIETKTKAITILDSPGHRQYLPQMISGAVSADCALLVVPGPRSEFESSFQSNAQMREHALLLRALGVQQILIAINKMDSIGFEQAQFLNVKANFLKYLLKLGFQESNLRFIPISALTGENLTDSKSPELNSWWPMTKSLKGRSTLIDHLDSFNIDLSKQSNRKTADWAKPLRISLADIGNPGQNNVGDIFCSGKILNGVIAVDDIVLHMPERAYFKVIAIKRPQGIVSSERRLLYSQSRLGGASDASNSLPSFAIAGDNVELSLVASKQHKSHLKKGKKDILKTFRVGDYLCCPHNPIQVTRRLRAEILIFNTIPYPMIKGFEGTLHCSAGSAPCHISKLLCQLLSRPPKPGQKFEKSTLSGKPILTLRPRRLPKFASGEIEIKLGQPLCCDEFGEFPSLSRFLLRDRNLTVAAGVIHKRIFK